MVLSPTHPFVDPSFGPRILWRGRSHSVAPPLRGASVLAAALSSPLRATARPEEHGGRESDHGNHGHPSIMVSRVITAIVVIMVIMVIVVIMVTILVMFAMTCKTAIIAMIANIVIVAMMVKMTIR